MLGACYCNLGNWVRDSDKPGDSLEWFQKAIGILQPVHEAEPRDRTAKEFMRNSYWGRAVAYDRLQRYDEAVKDWDQVVELSPKEQPRPCALRATSKLRSGQVSEAVAEVAKLRNLPGWNAIQLYYFACVYSVASGKVSDKKAEYADAAMELLQKAVKAGFKEAAHMKQHEDLDPLRDRDDFKKLLADLEAKFPPKKETLPPPRADK